MSRGIHSRLAKLETWSQTGDIPVWCETSEQVRETIEAMITEGEIRADQRERCVFWGMVACPVGAHDAWLSAILQEYVRATAVW